MKKPILCFTFFILHFTLFAQRDFTALVNPFIGTGGHGHTYPGASVPFGMMQLSPDTRGADWDGSSGYHYSDSVIYGFSHTHLSGTGIPDYCDVLFMPFVGDVKWNSKDYRSTFSHKNEKASPGYYEVMLDKGNIKAQLTTSARAGMHQYTFPQSAKKGSILIDLKWRDEVLESWIEKVSDYELRGLRRSKSWAQNQILYFDIRFERPIKEYAVLNDEGKIVNGAKTGGKNLKLTVSFDLTGNKIVRAKAGISGVSAENAKLNLDTEIKDWNFDKLRANAKIAWNKELSKIDVKGGTKDQQIVFYTALYHTFLEPNIYQDVDGQFRGTDLKVHKADRFTNYTVFSLWDTYRAYNPLMTIINQKRVKDWLNTFLHEYEYGGMLPVWELSGNETFCMVGYHSVPVIVDAYQKGIGGYDTKLMLQAMRSYAESDRFGLKYYRQYGYISNDKEHESTSKTLDYALDDWCIAQFAKMTGNDAVYKQYIQRAQNYKNLFDPSTLHMRVDPSTLHMRGKLQAMWYSPFDPKEINNFFTEGNSWQYSFAAPQDVEGLIQLYGGKEVFATKLNELFTTSSQTTGRDQSDVTGLIGQYAHGNEPSHHMAYLFNYVGMPWKTQELIHKICTEFYKNDPDGLIGNEDCGQMSAWYILSAMGFYPVCPGNGEYVLGTPLFNEVTINLENGKKFVIRAKKQEAGSQKSFYVQSTKLNGKNSTKSYLLHTDVMTGGVLEFTLSGQPSKVWGVNTSDLPHSKISDEAIVPVPYFDAESNKFKNSLDVYPKDIDPKAKVQVKLGNESMNLTTNSFINLKNTIELTAYAEKDGNRSKEVIQKFFKTPSDKSITVFSKVSSMYTAGGPDALIDSIEGTTNWKTGEWQSYYNQDFEAIIDLKKIKPVSYVGIHVLQDISPWIMYPKEVIFYSSDDGKNFTEATRVENKIGQADGPAQTQTLGTSVNLQTRYIKVKAVTGASLPAWHESAGNPSHIFIDEIIVK
ncbi:MAG TPA: GH92 family glycosyl hydrolase [Flavisolibacter sp.]|nr:GH92 family glycosyl hydrolase [Flavisolibacter sp.]